MKTLTEAAIEVTFPIAEEIEINEKLELDANIIKKIASATDRNDHTGASLILAKQLGHKKYEMALKGIEMIQRAYKHTPNEIISLRLTISKELWAIADAKFSNGDAIYSAF